LDPGINCEYFFSWILAELSLNFYEYTKTQKLAYRKPETENVSFKELQDLPLEFLIISVWSEVYIACL
jgi:hypothetical protein